MVAPTAKTRQVAKGATPSSHSNSVHYHRIPLVPSLRRPPEEDGLSRDSCGQPRSGMLPMLAVRDRGLQATQSRTGGPRAGRAGRAGCRLGPAALQGVAKQPAGPVQVPARRAEPIARLHGNRGAMGIIADRPPLIVVVTAFAAEPISWFKLLQ